VSSIKCKGCGMYFATHVLDACPRCSRGFGGSVEGNKKSESDALGGAKPKSGPGAGMWVLLVVVLTGVGGFGASAINLAGNSYSYEYSYDDSTTDYPSDDSTVDYSGYETDTNLDSSYATDSGYTSETDWIPYGYSAFEINSALADDDNYNPDECLNEGEGFCWMYQVVSKNDCERIEATMEFSNYGTYVGEASVTIYDVFAGTPTLLEIDAYDIDEVDESTDGTLVYLYCSPY
jgi:hypothetical protein